MSVRALGIALKLTFLGTNQLLYPQTWAFTAIVLTCVLIQLNYLNKVKFVFSVFYFPRCFKESSLIEYFIKLASFSFHSC